MRFSQENLFLQSHREVAERSKAHAWKVCIPFVAESRVRIPSSLLVNINFSNDDEAWLVIMLTDSVSIPSSLLENIKFSNDGEAWLVIMLTKASASLPLCK